MLTPPCEIACDAGEPVRGWLHGLQEDDALRAWRAITRTNPLPACMGRICYAPCEQGCVLGARAGPVGIRSLEAAVGELALREGWTLDEPRDSTGARVVVVGSGPCGLSAAHQLVLAGHDVTLLDAHHSLGGMLRRGITERRLPKRILDAEIRRIVSGRARVEASHAVRRIEVSSRRATASSGPREPLGAWRWSRGGRSGGSRSTRIEAPGARPRCRSAAGPGRPRR